MVTSWSAPRADVRPELGAGGARSVEGAEGARAVLRRPRGAKRRRAREPWPFGAGGDAGAARPAATVRGHHAAALLREPRGTTEPAGRDAGAERAPDVGNLQWRFPRNLEPLPLLLSSRPICTPCVLWTHQQAAAITSQAWPPPPPPRARRPRCP